MVSARSFAVRCPHREIASARLPQHDKMDAASMRSTIPASLPQVLVAMAILALTSSANGQGASEEQAIRKVITDFVDAIDRSDIKAFEALFTDDADFVVITGKYLKGRTEIVTYHAQLLTGSFKGSHLDITSTDIRFLRPDVAIARVATKRTENEGKEMRTSFPIFVLTRRADKWL